MGKIYDWAHNTYYQPFFGELDDINSVIQKLEFIFKCYGYVIPIFIWISASIIFFIIQTIAFNHISFRNYQIKLGITTLDKILFIMTWFSISAVFNNILLLFGINGMFYNFVAAYIVQAFTYFVLLRTNAYDQSIILRRKKITT